jgi:hypothetical protein
LVPSPLLLPIPDTRATAGLPLGAVAPEAG